MCMPQVHVDSYVPSTMVHAMRALHPLAAAVATRTTELYNGHRTLVAASHFNDTRSRLPLMEKRPYRDSSFIAAPLPLA